MPREPYGPSLGGRAGYTFDFGLYLGAFFMRGFGRDVEAELLLRETISRSSQTQLGPELGYELAVGPLVTHYRVGLGYLRMDASYLELEFTKHEVYITGSFQLTLPVGAFFVGAEVQVVMVPSLETPTGIAGYLAVGVNL